MAHSLVKYPNFVGSNPIKWKFVNKWDSEKLSNDMGPEPASDEIVLQLTSGTGFVFTRKDIFGDLIDTSNKSAKVTIKPPKSPYDGDMFGILLYPDFDLDIEFFNEQDEGVKTGIYYNSNFYQANERFAATIDNARSGSYRVMQYLVYVKAVDSWVCFWYFTGVGNGATGYSGSKKINIDIRYELKYGLFEDYKQIGTDMQYAPDKVSTNLEIMAESIKSYLPDIIQNSRFPFQVKFSFMTTGWPEEPEPFCVVEPVSADRANSIVQQGVYIDQEISRKKTETMLKSNEAALLLLVRQEDGTYKPVKSSIPFSIQYAAGKFYVAESELLTSFHDILGINANAVLYSIRKTFNNDHSFSLRMNSVSFDI